jgi:hypothetical protein
LSTEITTALSVFTSIKAQDVSLGNKSVISSNWNRAFVGSLHVADNVTDDDWDHSGNKSLCFVRDEDLDTISIGDVLLLLLPGLLEDSNTDSLDDDKEDSDGKSDDKDDSLDDDTDITLGLLFEGKGKVDGINSYCADVDDVASDDNVRLEDANGAPDKSLDSLLDKDDAVEVCGKEAHASPKITDVSLSPKLFPFMSNLLS